MVQEIIRQPDLLKALTGSSLRGSIHPMLDKFEQEDKLKYRHLERLEARKKFDVKDMKDKLEKKYLEQWRMNLYTDLNCSNNDKDSKINTLI